MTKKLIALVTAGFVTGFFIFAALRVILVKNHDVHYHANFALFINGKRDPFKSFTFYEEEVACSANQIDNPKHAAHMHDNVSDVVHVHAHAATWGMFFANLGYSLGNSAITTQEGTFVSGVDGKKLNFILNGKEVDTVANRVIESEDALLISYGDENNAALQTQYKQINHSAKKENSEQDPAACSGTSKLTLSDRIRKAFNFSN